jgi:hypothetical protein
MGINKDRKICMKSLILTLISTLLISSAFAQSKHVGMIVKRQGQVEILKNPGKKITGKGPHVLFEGLYYTVAKVRPGTKVENGNIVKTGKGGKIKVVFKNGDQYNVGEGTAYKVNWSRKGEKKGKKDASTISLMYGSLRGVISKKGPRSGLKVKTRNAVMGIRGTDFHIGQKGTSGTSSVAVLRGKVAVQDKENPKNEIQVEKGFSAEVASAPEPEVVVPKNTKVKAWKKPKKKAQPKAIQLVKTSKQELVAIQKDSKIVEDKKEQVKVSKEVKKQLAKLEEKAAENTLNDIKDYDPALYKQLKQKKIKDVDKINTVVVSKVFVAAPAKKIKPGFDDLDLDEDAYDKYFNIEDEE